MNAKKTTNPKKDKTTVPTKTIYSTLEGLESLCRRAMVYRETGEYLPPDPLPNICKNKYKRKAAPSKKTPNETQNKSKMFGKGRVGVSCEAYGVKHCTCCNPHTGQNNPSNLAFRKMIANLESINKDPVLIDSDDSIAYSPVLKRFSSEIIEIHDSSFETYKPYDYKLDSSIVSLQSDESDKLDFNVDKAANIIDEINSVILLPNKNDPIHNVNLDNNDVIPIDLNLTLDLPETSRIELKNRLLTKKEQIQKEIEECERNIKTIFAKSEIKYPLPKQPISTSKIKDIVDLTRRELLQKEIDECDRNYQKIFKKKTNIILPSSVSPKIKMPHNIQNTINNPVQTQIDNIVTTYNNSRTPLQEMNNSNKTPTPYSHRARCCPICFDSFDNKELMSTICGHIFCMECIKQVIKTTRACPTCRNRLSLKRIHPIYL